MSPIDLPDRASVEYLRKLAKDRLREMRDTDPAARLSYAQLAVAREHGYPSWRALKAEVDRRRAEAVEAFFAACETGDVEAARHHLSRDPGLATARHRGTTALHMSTAHPAVLLLLLEGGADPHARDDGDHALALHFAAGHGPVESVRILLDAGSDVQGEGDAHRLDVIGWATAFAEARRDVVDLLMERGGRHNIFSAIAMGDPALVRRVVDDDPEELRRRLSASEQEQTPLHYVVAPPDGLVGGLFRTGEHHETLRTLLELGADVDARDAKGRTALELAMLRGDTKAMQLLHDAGARPPRTTGLDRSPSPSSLSTSMGKIRPMLPAGDMEETVAWYEAIGFEVTASHGEGGELDWVLMSFGEAELMFVPASRATRVATEGLSLWINTHRLDDLYGALKLRQLERARGALAGEDPAGPEVRFTADLYTAFYGQREFGVRDPNGVEVMFAAPVARDP